jgi:hypothetical protein
LKVHRSFALVVFGIKGLTYHPTSWLLVCDIGYFYLGCMPAVLIFLDMASKRNARSTTSSPGGISFAFWFCPAGFVIKGAFGVT